MDQDNIKCFKACYKAGYIQCSSDNYEGGVTPSNIYDINQLDVMWLANSAWLEVDTTTIHHCWDKAGILLDMQHTTSPIPPALPIASLLHPQEDPISIAEKEVIILLDDVKSLSTLWVLSVSLVKGSVIQSISGSVVQDSDEDTKSKLDRWWEGNVIDKK